MSQKESEVNSKAGAIRYVSRAANKLDSVSKSLGLDFSGKTVLDVGSSTGGFSDYALKHGALRVIAVEKGTNQMDPVLRTNPNLELHEKTDIRSFSTTTRVDIILIDVSFVSLQEILPAVSTLANKDSVIVAMAKPQFETRSPALKHLGVIKNERIRRALLSELEKWLKPNFVVQAKADSLITGSKGNRERFYRLKLSN
ncbi:MAG: SAM-dependent methyltransferase [Candidatus Saccharimonadales bacterium]